MPPVFTRKWSPGQLLRMVIDHAFEPPTLALKLARAGDLTSAQVQVRRYRETSSGDTWVDKTYRGGFANRADHEQFVINALAKDQRITSGVVADGQSLQLNGQTLLRARWSGLSIQDWHTLLGGDAADSKSPFSRSCRALLALLRAVLACTKQFHEAGYLHCDLLLQNLVCPANSMIGTQSEVLLLNDLKMIDFEFSYAPVGGVQHRTSTFLCEREIFRDVQGYLVALHPEWHSAQLIPGPFIKEYVTDRNGVRCAQYRLEDPLNPSADYQARLNLADFGADFFTIAQWLKERLDRGAFADADAYPVVLGYLDAMPKRLLAFDVPNQLDAQGKPYRQQRPHAEWIAEIDRLIRPNSNADYLRFSLPTSQEAAGYPDAPDHKPTTTLSAEQPHRSHALAAIPFPVDPKQTSFANVRQMRALMQLTHYPKMIVIKSLGLEVSVDPVTVPDFEFRQSANGARPKLGCKPVDIEAYLSHLNATGHPTATLRQLADSTFRKSFFGFRLPTHEEWISICLAGFDSCHPYVIGDRQVREGELTSQDAVFRWSSMPLGTHTEPSIYAAPTHAHDVSDSRNRINRWGVRGMHGNVWELVIKGLTANGDAHIVACGGAFDSQPEYLRWDHFRELDRVQSPSVGFRVCRALGVPHI